MFMMNHDVLHLDRGDADDELSLPLTLLSAITLRYIWKARDKGTTIRSYKVRAELEQYVTLLRTTRLATDIDKLSNMASTMFQ